jgi:multidrug transporter EmrE-like cation transporter
MTAKITSNLACMLLVIAGLLEIVWAMSMKASHGFGEALTLARVGCITLIVLGILGLKFLGGGNVA